MATTIADIINASTLGNPVEITSFRAQDPTDITKAISINSSSVGSLLFKTAATANRTVTIPSAPGSVIVQTQNNNTQFKDVTMDTLKLNTIGPSTGFIPVDGTGTVTLSTSKIFFVPDPANSFERYEFISQNPNSTTFIKTSASSNFNNPINITFPSVSCTLATGAVDNNFSQIQSYQSGILDNFIEPITNGQPITLSANGAANEVVFNTPLKTNSITANSPNTNLQILSNGTGLPTIGANGLKLSDLFSDALSFYKKASFTASFSVGAFSTGNLTLKYERFGKRVIVTVPPATGTPSTNAVWVSSAFPSEIMSVGSTQVAMGGIGIKNTTIKGPICITINTNNTITLGHTTDILGFGNTGTCGWQIPWTFYYMLQ